MKQIVSRDVLLAYPNFNEVFELYAHATDKQLGAVIMQNGKPLAFYSHKLNLAQCNYMQTKCKLLSIVDSLKEFRNILLGQRIKEYMDHKNLVHEMVLITSE